LVLQNIGKTPIENPQLKNPNGKTPMEKTPCTPTLILTLIHKPSKDWGCRLYSLSGHTA